MYNNPHEKIKTACPICGSVFESLRYYNKEYCSPMCRRRAKHLREVKRYLAIHQPVIEVDDRYASIVNNPTTKALDVLAQVVLTDANERPVLITGVMPFWEPPTEIDVVKQYGVDKWIMTKKAPDIMSMLGQATITLKEREKKYHVNLSEQEKDDRQLQDELDNLRK